MCASYSACVLRDADTAVVARDIAHLRDYCWLLVWATQLGSCHRGVCQTVRERNLRRHQRDTGDQTGCGVTAVGGRHGCRGRAGESGNRGHARARPITGYEAERGAARAVALRRASPKKRMGNSRRRWKVSSPLWPAFDREEAPSGLRALGEVGEVSAASPLARPGVGAIREDRRREGEGRDEGQEARPGPAARQAGGGGVDGGVGARAEGRILGVEWASWQGALARKLPLQEFSCGR